MIEDHLHRTLTLLDRASTSSGTAVVFLVPVAAVGSDVTVISKTAHHLIASHHIDPDRNYWRNQQKTRPEAGILCNR